MNKWTIGPYGDGWQLPIEGLRFSKVKADSGLSLEVESADGTVSLLVSCNFEVRFNGLISLLDPSVPSALAAVSELMDHRVSSARVFRDGRLELSFRGGPTLTVRPDKSFEAWEFHGPHGARIVCLPGGGTSVWQPAN